MQKDQIICIRHITQIFSPGDLPLLGFKIWIEYTPKKKKKKGQTLLIMQTWMNYQQYPDWKNT